MLKDKNLDNAISHWWDNARCEDENRKYIIGTDGCALCKVRRDHDGDVLCEGIPSSGIEVCPIMAYTGLDGCRGTPWHAILFDRAHPAIMAWWLEDLCAERNPPIIYGPQQRGRLPEELLCSFHRASHPSNIVREGIV